jgi:hypothetical protein
VQSQLTILRRQPNETLNANVVLTASSTSFAAVAIPAAVGPPVPGEAQTVASNFPAAVTTGGANRTAIVGMAAALPLPDANTTYGWYGAGSPSVMLPIGTMVASLQAQLANQRAALALAAAGDEAAYGALKPCVRPWCGT